MAFTEKVGELFVELSAKKGNVADAFKAVRDDYDATTKKAQAYTAFMATGQGQEAARALVQSQAAASWAKLVAEQGRSGAMLTTISGKLKTIKGNLDSLGNMPLIGFGAATASIGGLAAAASPMLWGTLTSSFTLLAATIGQMFIPYIIEAARWIQTAARWFRELDPEVKTNIAGWVIAGVAATGFIVVLSRMLGVVLMLGSAFRMLGLSSLLFNPVALTALAVGATGLGVYAAGRTGSNYIDRMRSQGGPATQQEAANLDVAHIARGQVNFFAGIGNTVMGRPWDAGALGGGTGRPAGTGLSPGVANNTGWFSPTGASRPGDPGTPRLGGPDRLMMNPMFQSQHFGIEEAGRRMQQRAASMGELDLAIETQRMNATMEALNTNASANGPIARALNRIAEWLASSGPGGLAR